MKKTISLFLAALLFLLPLTASAEAPNVVDEPGILNGSEYSALLDRAEELSQRYGIDTILYITSTLNGRDPQKVADDIFDDPDMGYGYGDDFSGVLLLYVVEDRDLAISTYKDGFMALSDSRIDALLDGIVPDLSNGRYYDGLNHYLSQLETYYAAFENGEYDHEFEHGPMPMYLRVLIAVIIGLIVSLINILIMRSKMRTAVRQSGAADYITPGSYDLYHCRDIYLYSKTSRTRRQTDSGSGHSSHTSSSGRSHGGGTRHF